MNGQTASEFQKELLLAGVQIVVFRMNAESIVTGWSVYTTFL